MEMGQSTDQSDIAQDSGHNEQKKPGFWSKTRHRILIAVLAVLILAAGVFLYFWGAKPGVPAVVLVKPAPVAVMDRDDIQVDVRLTNLPDGVYPAASLSVGFDKNKLEFVGVRQGTMMTRGMTPGTFNIPIWASDPAFSNRQGQVTTMYLDMTGGDFAYVPEGFSSGRDDIVVRLVFRLRDSAQKGESYDLTVRDAVFATADDAVRHTGLATSQRTLRAFSTQIEVAS